MKPEFIKLCGLTTPAAIDATIAGGATHAGMIFFENSPRHIDIERAEMLASHAGNRIAKVAVSVDATDQYLDLIVAAARPDMLQLHGSETPERVTGLKQRHGLPVIKVFSVREAADLEQAKPYIGIADHIMFDSKATEQSDIPGGNGVTFNWEIMDQWPRSVPYILSGGLNVANVRTALERTAAWGLDASSGVESSPGVKDSGLVREFLRALVKEEECIE